MMAVRYFLADMGNPKGKSCPQCGRYLNDLYVEELCPMCQEINLFSRVRDYIRENEVNEYDVAEHFNIPLKKVRDWIREGRIQYKKQEEKSISAVHCRICGKPIDFGMLCSDCHRVNGVKAAALKKQSAEQSAMRFLNKK